MFLRKDAGAGRAARELVESFTAFPGLIPPVQVPY